MKIYLIAGEPSGDALGSRLMRALKRKSSSIEVLGVGGDSMEKEGLKSLFDISDLAIMGLAEVVPSIPKVLQRIREVVADIVKTKPDIVVTIDSWSFSVRVHEKLRKLELNIPQVHYVAPQVWAWKKKRAQTMHKYIDHLLTLLPNEPEYFTPYGLDTTFVGHPVIESGVEKGDAANFRKKLNLPSKKKLIALLPGSRHNEVSMLLPIFLEAAEELLKTNENFHFIIPTVHTVSARVKNMVEQSNLPVTIVEDAGDRLNAFKSADVAIAASGTVSLELAIAGVPHVIAYKLSLLSETLAKVFVKIKFVNLPNILLDKEIVPELILEKCTSKNMVESTLDLLSKGPLYDLQIKGFEDVRKILGLGKKNPSDHAAEKLIALAEKETCKAGVKCIYSYKK